MFLLLQRLGNTAYQKENRKNIASGKILLWLPCVALHFLRMLRKSTGNCRSNKQFDLEEDKEETSTTQSKCIPRSIKASLSKQPRSESMRSPLSDGPRISSDGVESSRSISSNVSNGGSKRHTEPSSGNNQSRRTDSFRGEKENVIKIEES